MQVAKYKVHPKYSSKDEEPHFDIALLRLAKPLKFSSTIKSIPLPKANEKYKEGANAFITGFGHLRQGTDMSKKLQGVEIPILKLAECKKLVTPYVTNTFCALSKKGKKDSCQASTIMSEM